MKISRLEPRLKFKVRGMQRNRPRKANFSIWPKSVCWGMVHGGDGPRRPKINTGGTLVNFGNDTAHFGSSVDEKFSTPAVPSSIY